MRSRTHIWPNFSQFRGRRSRHRGDSGVGGLPELRDRTGVLERGRHRAIRRAARSPGHQRRQRWSGRAFTSTHAGVTKSFTFTTDLPGAATANKRVLIGTQGLASLGFIALDYVIPDGFLAVDGGTLNFAGADSISYGSLPTDGVAAISRTGAAVPNVATNFSGKTVSLPALPVTAVEYYHAGFDHYFISSLQLKIDTLDAGRIGGWARTGQSFRVFPARPAAARASTPSAVSTFPRPTATRISFRHRRPNALWSCRRPRRIRVSAATCSNRPTRSMWACPTPYPAPVPAEPVPSTGSGTSVSIRTIGTRIPRQSRRR